MNAKHVELMQRLEQFQLDSAEATLPFSARLTRENNWTPGYTRRVIAEYKRFAALAIIAEHPVSPSEDVDQVWHLHLTYSEDYWKIFCPNILGKPLHHQPTRGGEAERGKFDDWYARTLQSYQTFFGEPPPPDIWPRPEQRRAERHNFVRVDRALNFVIPKPRLRLSPRYSLAVVLIAVIFLCGGAVFAQGANPLDWRGPDFLIFYVILFSGCYAGALMLRRFLRVPAAGNSVQPPELNGYEVAYLNGGPVLAVNTAIANLIRLHAMALDDKSRRLFSLQSKPGFAHELEQLVYAAGASGNSIANVRASAKSSVNAIADKMKSLGLVVSDAPARKAMVVPLLLSLAAVGVGVSKILVGLDRHKPVAYLAVLCVITGIISLITFLRRPLRSRYGDAVLRQLQSRYVGPRRIARDASAIPALEFAAIVGLFGMTALAGTDLAGLSRSLQPPGGSNGCGTSSSSSCGGDGGGGCGGGGCGGGCGGCGGG